MRQTPAGHYLLTAIRARRQREEARLPDDNVPAGAHLPGFGPHRPVDPTNQVPPGPRAGSVPPAPATREPPAEGFPPPQPPGPHLRTGWADDGSVYPDAAIRLVGSLRSRTPPYDDPDHWRRAALWVLLPAHFQALGLPLIADLGLDPGPCTAIQMYMASIGVLTPRQLVSRLSPRDATLALYGDLPGESPLPSWRGQVTRPGPFQPAQPGDRTRVPRIPPRWIFVPSATNPWMTRMRSASGQGAGIGSTGPARANGWPAASPTTSTIPARFAGGLGHRHGHFVRAALQIPPSRTQSISLAMTRRWRGRRRPSRC